jgi:Fe2+ or Zn2+ uptake regulation protein
MKAPSEVDKDPGQLLKKVADLCNNRGLTFTRQRKEVLLYLFNNNEAIEAETLWLNLMENKIHVSLPSIYAALRWLIKYEFAEQYWGPQKKGFYRLKRH